jgi:hypothetical protein
MAETQETKPGETPPVPTSDAVGARKPEEKAAKKKDTERDHDSGDNGSGVSLIAIIFMLLFGGIAGKSGGFLSDLTGGKGLLGGLGSMLSGFGKKSETVDTSTVTSRISQAASNTYHTVSDSISNAGKWVMASTGINRLLDVIGLGESGGDYNRVVNSANVKNVKLTGMTLDQVMDFQRKILAEQHARGLDSNHCSSALGKYQTNLDCLKDVKQQMGLTGNELFDDKLQDRIGKHLIATRATDRNGNVKGDLLANIWAGAPMSNGESRYKGVGNNNATIPLSVLNGAVAEANRNRGDLTLASSQAFAPPPPNSPSVGVRLATSNGKLVPSPDAKTADNYWALADQIPATATTKPSTLPMGVTTKVASSAPASNANSWLASLNV